MAELESVIGAAIESAGMHEADNNEFTEEAGIESGDESSDASEITSESTQDDPGEAVATTDEGQAAPEKTPTQEAVEDAFAKEHGLQQQKPGQKENRIPYSRVKAIAANAERKVAEAAGLTAIDPAKPLADQVKAHVARIPELETKVKDYETKFSEFDAVGSIMENSPERFLSMLPHVNPKYAELLSGKGVVIGQQPRQDAIGDFTEPMPEPDMEVPGGGRTYSLEGIAKLNDWSVKKAVHESRKAVSDELKPIREEREYKQRFDQNVQRTVQRVKYAEQAWPGFGEHADEILKTLQEDKAGKLQLEDAYAIVRDRHFKAQFEKMTTDRNKIRAEILEEMKKAPKATGTVPGSGKPAAASTGSPKSIEGIIKQQMERAKNA